MKLSVIIVNYNVKYFLEQCLLSVKESLVDFDLEVFVVDNNSTDNSLAYLKPKFPDVRFIENSDNPGFSKANNQAINLSSGEYVLLLNPDTVVGEHTLKNVCNFIDTHPFCGAIGVKMIDGSGTFLRESKRGFPSPWVSFCKVTGLTTLFPKTKLFGKYHLYYLNQDEVHEVDVLAGAFMMLRKDALNKSGLLDETFFMYGEDIDLSYRIIKAGYKNYYLPETIIHYKGESTKDDAQYVKVFYEAMYIFFKKHYPHYSKLYSYIVTLGIALRAGIAACKRLFVKKDSRKKSKKVKYILLDHTNMTYEQIIEQMDKSNSKNIQYLIYSPASNKTIGSQLTLEGKQQYDS